MKYIIIAFLFINLSFSQKIKIKGDKIIIDDKEVFICKKEDFNGASLTIYDLKTNEEKIGYIEEMAKKVNGVTTSVSVPPIANHTPFLKISWDPAVINLNRTQMQEKLRKGNPSIEVIGFGDHEISCTVWMLRPNEEKIVAKRILEELSSVKA